jgi:hypothetical protein
VTIGSHGNELLQQQIYATQDAGLCAASATLLRGLGDKVSVRIAKSAFAGEHGRVTLFERLVLAVPTHVEARVDDRTLGRLVGLCRPQTDDHSSKSNDSGENHADHLQLQPQYVRPFFGNRD